MSLLDSSTERSTLDRPTRHSVLQGEWSSPNPTPIQWVAWRGGKKVRARTEAPFRHTQLRGLPSMCGSLRCRCLLAVGLGAVGGAAFVELARAGIGRLEGVDPDQYGPESFMTQPTTEDAAYRGEQKAHVQGARAHAANPAARLRCTAARVQDIPLRLLYDADIWLVAADNAAVVVWLGEKAAAMGKVLVQGAVHPDTGLAILRAWDLRRSGSACPACGLGSREWAALHERAGCDPQAAVDAGSIPTRTLSPICVASGQLMAFEALKQLGGNEQLALNSEELTYSLWTHRAIRTQLTLNPACRASHEPWTIADAPATWEQVSPAVLMDQLGKPPGVDSQVMRAEVPWVSFVLCQTCQRQRPVRRFGHVAQNTGRCDCGGTLLVPPAGVRAMIPATELAAIQDRPLADLGLPPDRGIGLFVGQRWHYFLPPSSIFEFPRETTMTRQEMFV